MKRVHILPLFALLFLSWITSPSFAQELQRGNPDQEGISAERLIKLRVALDEFVKEGQLPGTVMLILKNGKVVFEHVNGMRDMESKDPMSSATLFRIASQSKAIISAGILLLQEDGKLSVTAPVSRYLPEFAKTTVAVVKDDLVEVVAAKRQITVRDLLTHTAGIGYGYGPAAKDWKDAEIQGWYFAHRNEPIRETVRRMAALPMDRQPGEEFVYGYNTDILGAVIEVVSGQPLNQFLQERIFDPLGMKDTHFYVPAEKVNRLAVVYNLEDQKLKRAPDASIMNGQGEYASGPMKSYSGGAGLISTAADYARFLQMILNGGSTGGKLILGPVSVKSMLSDHIGHLGRTNGTGFGLGFQVITDVGDFGQLSTKGEFSWGGAYHSTYFVSPEYNMVVVYFTQVIPAPGLRDHEKLRLLTYQAIMH
ncbi:MAG: serine hydrolase [Bacteroidetes bacterium]|nr:serine hydrolase [Bacteroidota bacterium]